MKRKLLTMLLVLCLVVTMMPAMAATAFAASSISNVTVLISAKAGPALNLSCSTPDGAYLVSLTKIEKEHTLQNMYGTQRTYTEVDRSGNLEGGTTYRLTINFKCIGDGKFSYATRSTGEVDAPAANICFHVNGKNTYVDLNTEGSGISGWTNDDVNEMYVMHTVTVPPTEVTGVTLDWTKLNLAEGATATIKAAVTPSDATNKTITWSSSDTNVATVSSSGLVTAKKAGTAIITAAAADGSGKSAACTVTVTAEKKPVTGVTLDKSSLSIKEGETAVLKATVSPADATDKNVTWLSSTPSVATVSASGVVTAIKAGTSQISVVTSDGNKMAICAVTVTAAETPEVPTDAIIDPSTGKAVENTFKGLEMELDYSLTAYTGNDKEPGVSIQDADGNDLTEGTDYTVKYYNNLAVGKATVIVTGMGKYAGVTAGANFTIKPKIVTVKSLKKPASGKLTVKWASHKTQTTGFQVRYSTSKSFKSGTYKTVTIGTKSTTSKTLTKLKKGKTYYVKVRAYKVVDGKKIYSSWSKVKSAKA